MKPKIVPQTAQEAEEAGDEFSFEDDQAEFEDEPEIHNHAEIEEPEPAPVKLDKRLRENRDPNRLHRHVPETGRSLGYHFKGVSPSQEATALVNNEIGLKKAGLVETQRLLAEIRLDILANWTDDEIIKKHKITRPSFHAVKQEIFRAESARWSKGTEDVFVQYLTEQTKSVHIIDQLIKRNMTDTVGPISGGTATALVAAARTRSEIYDGIIKRGQEFGIIEKVPEKRLIGGVLVAHMETPAIRAMVQKEITAMAQVQMKYGEHDILGSDIPRTIDAPSPQNMLPSKPSFTQNNKPGFATGGMAKASGGKATARPSAKPSKPSPNIKIK